MRFITAQILVPTSYMPPEDASPAQEEQHLVISLGDYFPRLVEEHLDDLPFLNNFDIDRKDIDVEYDDDPHSWDGYWFVIRIDLKEPREQIVSALRAALRQAIFEWFDSKAVKKPQVAVDLEWRRR